MSYPDWCDAGKMVEVLIEGQMLVTGKLFIYDFFSLSDGDEVPIFYVRLEDGSEISFADHDSWRFV